MKKIAYRSDDATAADLFRNWLVAAGSGDTAWFEAHLAPEFAYLNSGGGRMDRATIIASNQQTDNHYILQSAEGRWYGDLLVSIGLYSAKGIIPQTVDVSQAMRDKYAKGLDMRFSQVWRTDSGRRLCVVLQTTEVS